jgi:hypothetical protein
MNPGITFHAPENARQCEGMKAHTPKGVPILGVGVPIIVMTFFILQLKIL